MLLSLACAAVRELILARMLRDLRLQRDIDALVIGALLADEEPVLREEVSQGGQAESAAGSPAGRLRAEAPCRFGRPLRPAGTAACNWQKGLSFILWMTTI